MKAPAKLIIRKFLTMRSLRISVSQSFSNSAHLQHACHAERSQRSSEFQVSGIKLPLSPRERARVRGNETQESQEAIEFGCGPVALSLCAFAFKNPPDQGDNMRTTAILH